MMQAWFLFAAGVIATLQGWILVEVVALKTSVAVLQQQNARFASDIESEKRTRAKANTDVVKKIEGLEARLGC